MAKVEIVTVDLTKPDADPTLLALDSEWSRLRAEGKETEAQAVLDRMHALAAGDNRGLS